MAKQTKQKKNKRPAVRTYPFERFRPDIREGLSAQEVEARIEAGAVNHQPEGLTPSIGKIFFKNSLTLFNVLLAALAIINIWVGHPQQTLFIFVAITNTAMGIFQEIRAKKTLDRLSVLAQAKVIVVRHGKTLTIPQDDVVLDDILYLAAGDQVPADAVIIETNGLEVDESLLTGESNRIRKDADETVLSGSYVTGGQAYVRVMAVGGDCYANALSAEAKKSKKSKSRLLWVLNMIIRVLTIVIVPLGFLLFWMNYNVRGVPLNEAVVSATAAMTGMLPGGLIVLTGVTLTVGALSLARRKALVQSLPSIETLARADVLCLDKTGTITDGAMVFEKLEPQADMPEALLSQAVSELMGTLRDVNATAMALRGTFGESVGWFATAAVSFNSDRKWSGASFRGHGSFILGAPNMILTGAINPSITQANRYAAEGYRVLALAHTNTDIVDDMLPRGLKCVGLVLLTDSIRDNAVETFSYFAQEGVTLKVISGDNPRTVSAVAKKAQILGSDQALDMNTIHDDADLTQLVDRYTIFGHVRPEQKRALVKALQKNGHTVCMTGDGVNDILAMREADCSVAMAGGSSAARSACDFVLLSEDFGAMINVLKEGRRVINNIERVASLYLVNTIYSIIFTILYTFVPMPVSYPYTPLQLTPISMFTVGIPSFFLALRHDYGRPRGRMVSNIFEHAFPAALTIVFNTLYIQLAGLLFNLPYEETSTMTVFLIGVVGIYLLVRISQPLDRPTIVLIVLMALGFVLLFLLLGDLFLLTSLISRNAFFYLPLIYFSFHIHGFLGHWCGRGVEAIRQWRSRSN